MYVDLESISRNLIASLKLCMYVLTINFADASSCLCLTNNYFLISVEMASLEGKARPIVPASHGGVRRHGFWVSQRKFQISHKRFLSLNIFGHFWALSIVYLQPVDLLKNKNRKLLTCTHPPVLLTAINVRNLQLQLFPVIEN